MVAHMNDKDADSSPLTSSCQLPFQVFGVLLLTAIAAMLMELPVFDPKRPNPFRTGFVLLVLWCAGLLAWALRATRSHRSQFGISTILILMTVCALGFTHIFIPMTAAFVAMIADLGVARRKTRRADCVWRTLQALAGITGLGYIVRSIYHLVSA